MGITPYIVTFLIALVISLVTTPMVIKLANKLNVVDHPDSRRVHTKPTPRLGGLAIFVAFMISIFYALQFMEIPYGILVGAFIIVLTGFIDDKFQIRPWQKLFGQSLATAIVLIDGLQINSISMPFTEMIIPVSIWVALPVSFIWIIGITNAVNLIDGLDGLAGGVSAIAATSILAMALITGNVAIALMSLALIGSIIGFLFFNFNPAKIFMGDTGSMLLGFLLAVFSVITYKQVTFVTLIIPIMTLAVPIVDTLIAIVRRKLNHQPIMNADKNHLHHKLLAMGLTHRKTVLAIYGFAAIFGTSAVLFYQASLLGSALIFISLLITTELLIEKLALVHKHYRPMLSVYAKMKGQFIQVIERDR
jgi:UDP-GlcNAc:undecaprenyl-phosphate GlcNAc-1-phosphate transferase